MKKILLALVLLLTIFILFISQTNTSYAKKNPCDKGKAGQHNKHCTTPIPPPTTCGANLLNNGSFEVGTVQRGIPSWLLTGWQYNGGSLEPSINTNPAYVQDGTASLFLVGPRAAGSINSLQSTSVVVVPGNKFVLSAAVYLNDVSQTSVDKATKHLYLAWYNVSNTNIGTIDLPISNILGEWQLLSTPIITAPLGAATIRVWFVASLYPDNGFYPTNPVEIYLDNFVLKCVN